MSQDVCTPKEVNLEGTEDLEQVACGYNPPPLFHIVNPTKNNYSRTVSGCL